jgi:hypothetical protein
MPKVVITHNVVDVEQWLKGKSERAEAIGDMGGANVVDHVAYDGSKTIAVTCDTDDVEGLMAAAAAPSPDLAAAMERHGVIPPLTVFVEK